MDFKDKSEYVVFKELTGKEGVLTFEKLVYDGKPRKDTFKEILKTYDVELVDECLRLYMNKDNRRRQTVEAYNNFTYMHPIAEMLAMFVFNGLLNRDLTYNKECIVEIGDNILPYQELRRLSIDEGIILKDGNLFSLDSSWTHRIGSLWLYLNDIDITGAVRFTTDCLDPAPIYGSMCEHVDLDSENIVITPKQAIAMYNIYLARRRGKPFSEVLKNSKRGIIPEDEPNVRLKNAQMFQHILGKEEFDAMTFLKELKKDSYFSNSNGEPNG